MKVYLNKGLFEIDEEQLTIIEQNAYIRDPITHQLVKDWIKITEWIEMNGELINDYGYGKVKE